MMKARQHGNKWPMTAVLPAALAVLILAAAVLVLHPRAHVASRAFQAPASSCAAGISQSNPQAQQYQYEGNPCHLLRYDSNISALNYSLSGGVSSAIALYGNVLLIPMSQPENNAEVPRTSMDGTTAALPSPTQPFTAPSYSFSSDWGKVWGKLAAYDAITGKLLWEDNFSAPVMSQPIVVNGTAYISTGDDFINLTTVLNGIYAVNVSDGKIVWSHPTVSEHMSTMVYYNGELVNTPGTGSGYDSNSVFASNAKTGEPAWHLPVGGASALSSPALVGNVIYLGIRLRDNVSDRNNYYNVSTNDSFPSGRSAFFAVNLDTESIMWETSFDVGIGPEDMAPAVWNGIVVGGYAQTIGNRSVLGMNLFPGGNVTALNKTNLRVYLVGMNSTTGKILWKVDVGTGLNPPRSKLPAPTVYNGIVYTDSITTGMLYALNAINGDKLWDFRTGPAEANPTVAGNHVLAINQTGTLFVLDMNGTLVSEKNLGISMGWSGSGQLAVVGDKLAVGGTNGRLLVLPLSKILPGG